MLFQVLKCNMGIERPISYNPNNIPKIYRNEWESEHLAQKSIYFITQVAIPLYLKLNVKIFNSLHI